MITAGIDMGAKNVKAVVVRDGLIASRALCTSGFEQRATAAEAYRQALQQAGLQPEQIQRTVVTGAGRKEAPLPADDITEVRAASRGVIALFPSVRTVIDVGAEEGRGICCDASGKVLDFAINEKCAAGAGTFTEAMARALEVSLEELAELSLRATQSIPMNAQCAVFAESEVVSLLHAKTPKEDIARAIHDAIASRIISMVRRVGVKPDVALVGGMALNRGFLESLRTGLAMDVLVPEQPEYVGAFGAALVAEALLRGG
jgi:benzoyl-CoA reductase subunit D